MKSSSCALLVLVIVVLAVCIEARGKKHDKHDKRGGHGPANRHPGGKSRLGHGHDQRHHNHDHNHGQNHHSNDRGYDQGHGYQYDHDSRTQTHESGLGHYDTNGRENGHRHRRDILNGTDQMNDTMSTNETTTLEPGRCTKLVSVTITFAQSYQTSRKVQTIVRCGWLHLAKCRVYKIGYELSYRQATRVVYAQVRKCCPGFMEVDGVCEPIGGRTTPSTTMEQTTTPEMNATTTMGMTTTDIPDGYMVMIDDKIQKLVSAIIIIILIIFTGCAIGGCIIYLCKICHKNKKANYI